MSQKIDSCICSSQICIEALPFLCCYFLSFVTSVCFLGVVQNTMCRNDVLTFSPSQSIWHLPEAFLKPSARVAAVSFLVVLCFDAFSQRVVTMSFPFTGPPSQSTCLLQALLKAFATVVSCVFLSCVVLWCLFWRVVTMSFPPTGPPSLKSCSSDSFYGARPLFRLSWQSVICLSLKL